MIAENIQNDWRKADLNDAQRAMLEYTEKLTLTPAMMEEKDVDALRDVGWTDRDVLDIASACAYFNFRVRMVDGLGLELGDWRSARQRCRQADVWRRQGLYRFVLGQFSLAIIQSGRRRDRSGTGAFGPGGRRPA